MDHWAKFHILFPLVRKLAAEVAVALSNQVFAVLGTQKILHSDNGREFVNEIIHSIVKEWPGEVMVINGRPKNPKCQGLIEQGNGMVEKLLGCRLYAHKGDSQPVWSEWLPFILCKSVYQDTCTALLFTIVFWCRSTKYNCPWYDENHTI